MTNLSKNIRLLRDLHGLTQKEFGAIVGASNKSVSSWEHEAAEPSFAYLVKYAEHFNVELEFFNSGDLRERNRQQYDKYADLIHKLESLSQEDRWKLEGRIDLMIEQTLKKESSEKQAI